MIKIFYYEIELKNIDIKTLHYVCKGPENCENIAKTVIKFTCYNDQEADVMDSTSEIIEAARTSQQFTHTNYNNNAGLLAVGPGVKSQQKTVIQFQGLQ